jgi:hypothetical protein
MGISVPHLFAKLKGKEGIMEATFSQLAQTVTPERQAKSKSIVAQYREVSEAPDRQCRTIWGVPSQSGNGTYDVYVDIVIPTTGGLFAWSHNVEKMADNQFGNLMKNADVRVSCTCEDFYWSGIKYNNMKGKSYASGNPKKVVGEMENPTPPVVRDPEQRKRMCKHIKAVYDVFPSKARQIIVDVRKHKPSDPESKKAEVINSTTQDLLGGLRAGDNVVSKADGTPLQAPAYEPAQTGYNMLAQDDGENLETTPEDVKSVMDGLGQPDAVEATGEKADENISQGILGSIVSAGKWLGSMLKSGWGKLKTLLNPTAADFTQQVAPEGSAQDIVGAPEENQQEPSVDATDILKNG